MAQVVLADRYRIERILGRGGMGAVAAATDLTRGELVAVKLLDEARLGDDESRARFSREAQLGAKLRSAHAARILDRSEQPAFFVLEYLTGESLELALDAQGIIEPRRAVAIATAILEVLAELHALGFVHADVKPGNVFLVEGGGAPAKLLDLGLATPIGQSSLGETTAYASPEQARGEPLDPRSDVHAVGMTLHRMLTGALPFEVEPIGVFFERLEHAPRPRAGIDPVLDDIVLRALAPRRGERFATASELRDALLQRRGDPNG